MRDTSLRVLTGAYIIVDVQVFTPENSDELQPGVREVVRCYIAQKRKISVGDKMASPSAIKGVVPASCRRRTHAPTARRHPAGLIVLNPWACLPV